MSRDLSDDNDSFATSSNVSFDVTPETIDGKFVMISDTLKVYSLDADGCFLARASKNQAHFDLNDYNSDFFSQLVDQLKECRQTVIFFVGSARQSGFRDLVCAAQKKQAGNYEITDSYFFSLRRALEKLNAVLPLGQYSAQLNQFLLEDIAFNKKPGESFDLACETYGKSWADFIRSSFNREKKIHVDLAFEHFKYEANRIKKELLKNFHDGIFLDESTNKFALLYAQIHHIASAHSDRDIEFHFYDDRLDILMSLFAVLLHRSDLIPANVEVYFHHYVDGNECFYLDTRKENAVMRTPSVRGSGFIDHCYRETVKDMFFDFEIQKEQDGELGYKMGDPLTHFFNVMHEGEFTALDFLSRATIVSDKPPFLVFNEKRETRYKAYLESMSDEKTPSLAGFDLVGEAELLAFDLDKLKSDSVPRLTLFQKRQPSSFFRDKSPLPNKPDALVCPPEFFPASPVK